VVRRKWLEENPESSKNEDPVVFDTSTIPWWAWVKRFHLPEAELLNGKPSSRADFVPLKQNHHIVGRSIDFTNILTCL
jgi:hypothetical protein